MSWAKVAAILGGSAVVAIGIIAGMIFYASNGEVEQAEQQGKGKPGGKSQQVLALQKSHRAGEKLGDHSLGCLDGKGQQTAKECANLAGIDLNATDGRKPADMAGGNLSGANLLQANLSWVIFKGANLRGANLGGAKLYRTNFAKADLSGADLSGADMLYADLTNTNLTGANLGGAKNLRQGKLERACLTDPNNPPKNLPADLKPPVRKCK